MNNFQHILHRAFSIFILCVVCALSAYAQDVKGPDLQTVNDGFFDPTRKDKKVREDYHFAVDYRIEAGYLQNDIRFCNDTARYGFLHGFRVGATFDFKLPYTLSVQTGALYSFSAGGYDQHWSSVDPENVQIEYLHHTILQHELTIPVRLFSNIKLPKKWGLVFYTGPQMQIGLSSYDKIREHLSDPTEAWLQTQGYHTTSYDRYAEKEIRRFTIQWGVGGGFEYDIYRFQAGYDFGLNNINRNYSPNGQFIWEWQWNAVFSVKIK